MTTVTTVAEGATASTAAQDWAVTLTLDDILVVVATHHTVVFVDCRIFGSANLVRKYRRQPYIGTYYTDVWIIQGLSGSGNVTLDSDIGIEYGYTILKLSDVNEPTEYALSQTAERWYYSQDGNGTGTTISEPGALGAGANMAAPALAAGPGAVMVSVVPQYSFGSTWPSELVEGAPWTRDSVAQATNYVVGHRIPTAASNFRAGVKISTAGTYAGELLMRFGTEATPPPAAGADGWGIPI